LKTIIFASFLVDRSSHCPMHPCTKMSDVYLSSFVMVSDFRLRSMMVFCLLHFAIMYTAHDWFRLIIHWLIQPVSYIFTHSASCGLSRVLILEPRAWTSKYLRTWYCTRMSTNQKWSSRQAGANVISVCKTSYLYE
jgi:hypothetical protein